MVDAPRRATLTVERFLSGCRIDKVLARHFRSYTSWRMHRLVRAGHVTINGEVADPKQRVFTGQTVTVRLIEPPDDVMPPEPIPLKVVYEDEHLIVVDKPAGLIVHPCGETPRGTLTNAVQWHLDQSAPLKGLYKPGVVHRLDRDTSGLIALAKDHLSHRHLSLQFERGRVAKGYVALVEGVIAADTGVIDLPIGRVPSCKSALMTARADALEARPSRTAYEVLERLPAHTLVKARPRTGRLHQIRVHLAALGHPVVGDEYYAAFGELKPPRSPLQPDGKRPGPPISQCILRHALHAAELSFSHPMSNEWLTFEAALPEDMARAVEALREQEPRTE